MRDLFDSGIFLNFFFFSPSLFFSPCVLDSHMWLSQHIQPPLDYHVTHKSTNNGSCFLSIRNPLKNRGNLDTLPLKWPLSFFFLSSRVLFDRSLRLEHIWHQPVVSATCEAICYLGDSPHHWELRQSSWKTSQWKPKINTCLNRIQLSIRWVAPVEK